MHIYKRHGGYLSSFSHPLPEFFMDDDRKLDICVVSCIVVIIIFFFGFSINIATLSIYIMSS